MQDRATGSGSFAEDAAMRRSAEMTLDRGYNWFQIVGRSRNVSDELFNRYDRTRSYSDDATYRDRPVYGEGYDDALVVIEIVMGYDPAPRASSIYDARRVLDYRSGPRY